MVDEMKKEVEGPKDNYKLVYIIFYWLGIGTLLPWNMFITVFAYWNYKFRTVETSEGLLGQAETNDLQKAFNGYLAVASMVPNVAFLILNSVFGHKFKTQPRLIISLVFVILMFTFTSIMVKIDTDEWQSTFLTVTLVSVVFININAAIFQGGILGVAGKFPPAYMGAVFSGQAVGGIFASGTNVVVLAMGATPVQSAFFCFLISVAFLLTALVAYGVVSKSEFYQHYLGETPAGDTENKADESKPLAEGDFSDGRPNIPEKVNPLKVLIQVLPYGIAVFLTFLVTLGAFPAITAQVTSTLGPDSAWSNTFYVPVACFLLFNVGDYIGRVLAGLIQWPRPGKAGAYFTLLLSILRFVFIPLFLFCNLRPSDRSVSPILFESDVAYIVIMALFSISNGYVGTICMMSGPQTVRPEEAQTAASLLVALLGLGLGSGAALANIFVKLI